MSVRRLRTSWLAFLIAGAFLAAACHATRPVGDTAPVLVSPAPSPVSPSGTEPAVPSAPADEAADNAINHVIAISIDGLNPRAIEKLGQSRIPAFHRLMREGAYTLNARTAHEQTSTMPNHTAMLTGRRVNGKGGHGYKVNFDNGSTVHRAAGHYVASVFDMVHDHGGSTAMFATKTKFALYKRTWNTHGAADRTGPDDGRAKIDRVMIDQNNTRVVAKLTAELRRSPREFTFVHLSLPDRAGHAHRFMGREYLTAVQRTDQLLDKILNTVASRPAVRRHTLVLLTADHGGRGRRTIEPASFRITGFPLWLGVRGCRQGEICTASTPASTALATAAPTIAESSRSVTPTSRTWQLMPSTCRVSPAPSSTVVATLTCLASPLVLSSRGGESIGANGVYIP